MVAQKQSCVSDPAFPSNLLSNSHVCMLVHLCRSGTADEDAGSWRHSGGGVRSTGPEDVLHVYRRENKCGNARHIDCHAVYAGRKMTYRIENQGLLVNLMAVGQTQKQEVNNAFCNFL